MGNYKVQEQAANSAANGKFHDAVSKSMCHSILLALLMIHCYLRGSFHK